MSGDWIEWKGGECPVAEDIRVDTKFADGKICTNDRADTWSDFFGEDWWKLESTDPRYVIIAYRLSSPSAEVRPGEQG